jgi:acyl transferase domain-containing protein/NADPH:quinone reductase-like Zn-dependent oxidoreductase
MMREPIAIIGMGCRFPGGVNSPTALWELLCAEQAAITEVPPSRYDIQAYYDPRPATPGKVMSKWGGFLDQIDRFDPLFFGISPREADRMDPQQRLLLEVAWEAMEDAGQVPNTVKTQQTGVFVGMWLNDFEARLFRDPAQVDFYMTTGSGRYTASGRLSYVLGLQGPSITLDTACSSSLVAVHLAAQSLRSGECNLALAGGANVILQPHITIAYSQSRMMAPDGRCKFGDARADGYVRSEGAGIVVLKRLSDALADHDNIYAIIRGSSTNNDGRSSGYLTTPGQSGQEEMLRKAYQDADLAPSAVQYIEAHGTGTAAGDPVEIGAIGAVVAPGRADGQLCTVGSVKTNLGHTEGAAGIAGLMKVALSLKHREIPASLNFESPNPTIPWEALPVRVQAERTPWPAEPGQAVGGVSSFGIAGTNAHVVLQEISGLTAPDAERRDAYILPLSAHTPQALTARSLAYGQVAGESDLHDLAYTASARRAHHAYRLAAVARSSQQVAEQLQRFAANEPAPGVFASSQAERAPARRVVFVFPGQGAQWFGMGRQLYEQEPVFCEALERCAAALSPYVEWNLLDVMLHSDERESRFEAIDVIQPVLFAIQVALAELWRSYGVVPDAVIGHSMGEVAAAHIAGILNLDQAARVIAYRSQLMKRVSGKGAMAMVELPFAEARAALGAYAHAVDVAVTNSPRSCVLSGDPAALAEVVAALESRDVFTRPVKVNVAAHSPHMDALRPELVSRLSGLQPASESVPVYSTVTGELRESSAFDAEYWGSNLRQPVLFAQAVERALGDGYNTFIEISPHPVLLPSIERGLKDYGLDDETAAQVAALPSTKRGEDERPVMLESLANLYVRGYDVDWQRLYPQGGRVVPLPAYPWQRDTYWFEPQAPRQGAAATGYHPLLGQPRRSAMHPDTQFWEATLDATTLPYLADHRVEGNIVLPAAAYAEMTLAALAQLADGGQIEAMDIQQALVLSDTAAQTLQLAITKDLAGTYAFRILSSAADAQDGEWTLHASGIIRADITEVAQPFSLQSLKARCQVAVNQVDYYQAMQNRGLQYGPHFQVARQFWHDPAQQEGLAQLQMADDIQTQHYQLHPTLLDGCLQLLVALLAPGEDTYLPVHIDRVCLYQPVDMQADLWGYAVRSTPTGDRVEGDVFLLDADGKVQAGIYGMRLQRVSRAGASGAVGRLAYHVEWVEMPSPDPAPAQPDQSGSWLLLTSNPETGAALANHLADYGEHSVIVSAGTAYGQPAAGHYTVRPDEPEDFQRLLSDLAAGEWPACRGIVHLWSLDTEASAVTADLLALNETRDCVGALHLIQALGQAQPENPPRLWLVTRGAQTVAGTGDGLAQSMLWGLGAVIANEHAELRPVRLDLDPDSPVDTDAFIAALWADGGEDQIAFRGGKWYSARLAQGTGAEAAESTQQWRTAAEQPFRVEVATPGILDSLELRAMTRTQPGPGQVEIEVRAAGLNFMNVMSALGTKPGYANGVGPLGIECAGVVTAVGDGVDAFQVGDAVMGVVFDSLATHALADARLLAHKPERLSFADAASIPIVFLTAYYSLFTKAQLEAGERVLIHAAAGGVGLAAVQLAQQAGAEIYATVGSPEKRAYLQSLGVEHIMDSRKLTFADEALKLTNGEGVDVVLNSLAGEAISRGLAILRTYGRFVEIGARDIYENKQVGLMPFHKNLSYFAVDLDKMARERPAAVGAILRQLAERFERGELQPLPTHVFSIDEAADAFRFMAQAKHIGKIVLEQTEKPVPITFAPDNRAPVREDGTYLITGGLGGLGIAVAQWLVEQGARNLILTGRRGPSAAAQAAIHQMEQAGAVVEVAQADVADEQALARVIEGTQMLRGVVHAAGILDDSLLTGMTRDQMRRVLAPKVDGAWNLHRLTENQPLDFFVLFSSVTALLGTPGQGNYAAGNAFLDALAHYRHRRGLPALSINWGPWSDVGLAAAETIRGERLSSRGLKSLSPEAGISILDALMSSSVPPQVAVMDFAAQDWISTYPASAHASLLAALRDTAQTGEAAKPAPQDFRQTLLNTEPGPQRRSLFESHLREQVAQVLRMDAGRIGLHQPLRELGIDSLLTLELRNRLEASFKLTLSATLIFNYPTIAALTKYLAEKLNMPLDKAVEAAAPAEAPDSSASELDALSRDEIAALLEDELKSIDDLLKGT